MKCRRRRSDAPRRELLLLRFGLISALITAILGAVLTLWLGNFIRTTNIDRARGTAEYSLKLSINVLHVPPGQSAVITPDQLSLTTKLMQASVATGTFVGATSWSGSGVVTYAAEPGRIGRTEAIRPGVVAALSGHASTAIITAPSPAVPDPTERSSLRKAGPLLEIYEPVYLRGKLVAACALYQPWRPVQRLIQRETRQMLLLVVAGLLVLWLGVMRLVLSASRKLRKQARENWELASHDPLTGLPNRVLLSEKVCQAISASERSQRRVGLLLFDLNRFKEVNDTFGHHTGDQLLKQVGPRLSGMLREGDFVARLGGDEFVVVLPALDRPGDAELAAARLLESLADPFRLDTVTLDVSASIGIAVSPDHGRDVDTLLHRADTGMYLAKKSGRGFATYSGEAESARPKQRPLLESLRAAIADPSQFVVRYQPKADLRTGVVHGVEALLRWEHPTQGCLLPPQFLPVAEHTGLAMALTEHLIAAVLNDIRAWSAHGLQLAVSVNVSSRCLLDASFPSRVSALLDSCGVDAGMLEIETTEAAILADVDRATSVLRHLDELGIKLALDGFGSGFSSLGYLTRLPLHQLKIDPSLVTSVTDGPAATAIVRSCIELARNLGLGVVADGVETAGVWDHLTILGCELAQGPHLAEPMPAEQLPEWMHDRARTARLARAARRTIRV